MRNDILDPIREDELTLWYMEQQENEIQTQEDYHNTRKLFKKVLKKLVKVTHLIYIV